MSKLEQTIKNEKADEVKLVIDYLRTHKDFFVDNPDVLAQLDIPHQEGEGAVSLIEKQVAVLRQQSEAEQKQLYSLVQTARDNERVADRLHRIALELLGLDNLDDVLDSVPQLIKDLFNVEHVSLRVTSSGGERAELVDARSPTFADLCLRVMSGQSVCDNQLAPAAKSFLFGEDASIASVVLIPLGGSRPCGILALGSPQADRFKNEHGTLYLDRLGDLLGAAVRRLSNNRSGNK